MDNSNLLTVDWKSLPIPEDDGAASHLEGMRMPNLRLPSVEGSIHYPVPGIVVLYVFPMMARPGHELPSGWNEFPGARGCTPQSCAFKKSHEIILASGADAVHGLSCQPLDCLAEAKHRLALPYDLISDSEMILKEHLSLPSFSLGGNVYYKRMTLVIIDGLIRKVFYPVFPPDENPGDVISFLTDPESSGHSAGPAARTRPDRSRP